MRFECFRENTTARAPNIKTSPTPKGTSVYLFRISAVLSAELVHVFLVLTSLSSPPLYTSLHRHAFMDFLLDSLQILQARRQLQGLLHVLGSKRAREFVV